MTYKVGDLVYFDNGIRKGVGKIVGLALDNPKFLVHSTQIVGGHDGNGFVDKQNNDNNWYFSEEELKPFTKKIGQKYKVLHDDSDEFEVGDIVTLHHIDDDCVSYYKKDSVENYMYDLDHPKCELEFHADVEEHKEREMFTKEDLKVGYLVKLRNGELTHIVNTIDEGMCLNNESSWDTLHFYNNDLTYNLTCKSAGSLDIIEVFGLTLYGLHAHKFEIGNRKLLWKREEVKEMTIEDIQKVLGHKIKVVE